MLTCTTKSFIKYDRSWLTMIHVVDLDTSDVVPHLNITHLNFNHCSKLGSTFK